MRTPWTIAAALCLAAAACVPGEAKDPVRAQNGMVVAQEPLAVDVGVRVLKDGGNAIDAAVAVAFALAVTHPQAGNIGGGGFMLIRFADGRSTFLDFRERAPGAATRRMYIDGEGHVTRGSVEGWTSPAVPGTVRGLDYAVSKYGTRKLAELVAPAVAFARDGFPVSDALAESLKGSPKLPDSEASKRIFLKGGAYFQPGDSLRQPELAAVLERIGRDGAKDFYEGETAKAFVDQMVQNGGFITAADLHDYKVVERKPLEGTYHGYGIISAPPPSSGGVGLLEMLGMLDGTQYEKAGPGSASAIHYEAEVMRRFFADRSQYLADPDVVPLRLQELLSPAYWKSRRSSIKKDRATPSDKLAPGLPRKEAGSNTTHLNVVDSAGNAVALTYTLNDRYGNGITVPGLGFLLNDEMDDFTAKADTPNMFGLIQGELNTIAPGKRPLSSMTPTILTHDGKFFMSLGAPGGSRIITAVMQVLLNVVDFKMNVQDAVDAPRVHHQWQPDTLFLEPGISPEIEASLKSQGYVIDHAPGWVPAQVNAILKDGPWLEGASDGRAAGKAAGY